MRRQKTVSRETSFSGVGLHTGKKTTITFRPAPPDTGVVFIRTDLSEKPRIKADVDHVTDVTRGTTIGLNGVKVLTIEHVLAAFAGLGIDNVYVELDASEAPVGDGSALPFVDALANAGLTEQDPARREVVVTEPVMFEQGDIVLLGVPSERLKISYMIEYGHPALGVQFKSFVVEPEEFAREIAPSRTFCFLRDVELLKKQGLIKGGSLENAVVIGDEGILNEVLRFEDEFVRHKVLDLLGDLSLLGMPLVGHIVAMKAGHAAHVEFVKKLKARTRERLAWATPPDGQSDALDTEQICGIIPHRPPFLFLDEITKLDNRSAVGFKRLTGAEEFFKGHVPGNPIMPGVLIIEAIAQVGSVLVLTRTGGMGKLPYMVSIDKAKFRKPVYPGDQLELSATILNLHKKFGKLRGEARVGGNLAAECEISYLVPE
ncbi:MAG: bifunctional UDP-3-O-[3-hydroxymyristoyl] N-acetylglucosamine deacetylase/3-hydroxyacyl-ACP dehydratase [Candidatus Abyssubacteria bacterium]